MATSFGNLKKVIGRREFCEASERHSEHPPEVSRGVRGKKKDFLPFFFPRMPREIAIKFARSGIDKFV